MNCDAATSHVFPYVDGELAPALRDEMQAHLAGCPSCRRLVEHEVAFRDAYVSRLRPDPAPPHVRENVHRLLETLTRQRAPVRRAWRAPWAMAAAAVLLLAVGVGVGMNVKAMFERRSMLAELTEASVEQHQQLARGVLPPDITGVSVKAAEEWLRGRLDFKVSLPEPKNAHLSLVGARISHLANVQVAAVEYRLDRRHVSLFVIPEEAYARLGLSEKPKFKALSHRGYDVIIWRQHGVGYALVSDVGNRSCQVCHAPDERLDTPLESLRLDGTTSSRRSTRS
jgi:anti-sigma factor (TIGR02949 family)